MSDSRIHLVISYHQTEPEPNYNNWLEIRCFYPDLDEVCNTYMEIHQSKFIDKKLKGLEALVRSLASSNFGWRAICPKCNKTSYNTHRKKHEEWNWPCCDAKLDWKFEYNDKLKVTFGTGTYVDKFVRETTGFVSPMECEYTKREIIEPLQPIEQVCKELGVELFYVQ